MEHVNILIQAAQRDYKSLESVGVTLPYPATTQQVVVRAKTVLYLGSNGCLRASHRHVDEAANWLENNPIHSHRRDTLQPIETGKVTPFTTGLWPVGTIIAKGEGLRLWIGAIQVFAPEFSDIVPDLIAQSTNKGTHTLHYGAVNAPDKSLGQSRVIVPVAPFSV